MGIPDISTEELAALLVSGAVLGFILGRRGFPPLHRLVQEIKNLTPDRLLNGEPPRIQDRYAQVAVDHLWSVGRGLGARERELVARNMTWQRRYGQANALIDLMAEFNRVMHLGAVLERLSQGLSRFFAGDGVAIWIGAGEGTLELAASVEEYFPFRLRVTDDWVQQLLTGDSAHTPPPWLNGSIPWMAAALSDAQGQRIGIVTLVSRRRSAYAADDRTFLRKVIAHAALAIENATMYQSADTLSRVDPLTGLPNRREFDRQLHQEVRRAQSSRQPLSLVMIDVDHFKTINDRFGHPEGDRVLQQLARLILLVPRRSEDAAFRIGGEEFAVLLTETDEASAMSAADALRRIVERTKFFDADARLTISLGVATSPGDGQTATTLIKEADAALYQAKAVGRNQVQAA